jgi:glycosyltransferase involved in cell wall biosynthesis
VQAFRLALVSDTFAPQLNGVTRTLDRLVAAMESRGGAVHVETVADPRATSAPNVLRAPSIPFWAYPEMRIAWPGGRAMADRLARFRPDLVHATTPFGVGISGLRAARALLLPIVSSYHTSYQAYLAHYGLAALDPVTWPVLRWFHNATLRTYAPSESTATELRGRGIARVDVWSRGVDLARFSPRFRDRGLRARLGATDDSFLVVYVGRLASEKGLGTAFDAIRALMHRAPGTVRFALAGGGPAFDQLRAVAPPLTVFTGPLGGDELSAFYASADALVFPSATETFGNVILEAMASGVPVVAPDAGATVEVADERTALTFPAGDAEALADRLDRLRRDRGLRDLKRAAGSRVAAERGWERVWDRLFADYRAFGRATVGRGRAA